MTTSSIASLRRRCQALHEGLEVGEGLALEVVEEAGPQVIRAPNAPTGTTAILDHLDSLRNGDADDRTTHRTTTEESRKLFRLRRGNSMLHEEEERRGAAREHQPPLQLRRRLPPQRA